MPVRRNDRTATTAQQGEQHTLISLKLSLRASSYLPVLQSTCGIRKKHRSSCLSTSAMSHKKVTFVTPRSLILCRHPVLPFVPSCDKYTIVAYTCANGVNNTYQLEEPIGQQQQQQQEEQHTLISLKLSLRASSYLPVLHSTTCGIRDKRRSSCLSTSAMSDKKVTFCNT